MSETLCPFCGHAPFHYVDNGCGMEAVAVTCCDLGDQLFRGRRPVPDEVTLSWDEFVEIANRLRVSPQPEANAAVTEEQIARELIAHGEFSSNPNNNYRNALQCARAILALQAGQSEAVSAYAAWHPTGGIMMSSVAHTAEDSADFAPSDVTDLGWRIVPVEIRRLTVPNHPEVDRG